MVITNILVLTESFLPSRLLDWVMRVITDVLDIDVTV